MTTSRIILTAICTATIATILSWGIATSDADSAPHLEYRACSTDEGPDGDLDCVWDARHQGNGLGNSLYVGPGGKVTILPHHIAHYLLNH